MAKTLLDEWNNAPANERSLEQRLEREFPYKTFKVTWRPFNIHVEGKNGKDCTPEELKAIQRAAEEWHLECFGSHIVWGTPLKS